MSARARVLRGGVSGRTRRSAPTRGGVWEPTEISVKRSLSPTGRDGARPLQGEREWTDGGVWSPRPTGATLVVCSSGPMYLRHGFRRPNFVPKFGASVMGIGHYALRGTGERHAGVVVPYGGSRGGFINCQGSALSAERVAGQIRFLPDN